MSNGNNNFRHLELLNAEIDVLIDGEEYEKVQSKIILNPDTEYIWHNCFKNALCTQELDDNWFKALGEFDENFLTSVLIEKEKKVNLSGVENQRTWSALFWAKRLRCEIQRRNTDCYLRRLDDLVGFLERNLPNEPAYKKGDDFDFNSFKLFFYFFMELSAVALDFEQIGYSKRFKRIIDKFPRSFKINRENKAFFITANHWLTFNEGLAYLHLGLHHKASLELNSLIIDCLIKPKRKDLYLEEYEYALFYYPAFLFRAIIQLKLQFPYDCLRTLELLGKSPDIDNYKGITYRVKLLSAQALRVLELRDESEEQLKYISKDLFPSFKDSIIDCTTLPQKENDFGLEEWNPLGLRTRLIELLVHERLERVKGVGYPSDSDEAMFKNWVERGGEPPALNKIVNQFQKVINMYSIMDSFLYWVRYNNMDRGGYYWQVAEVLAWSAQAVIRFLKEENLHNNPILDNKFRELKEIIVRQGISLINNITEKTPEGECPSCSVKIRLERLRGEDYDSLIRFTTNFLSIIDESWINEVTNFRRKFANVVNIKEKTKGENTHIRRVDLGNRLKLFSSDDICGYCMDNKHSFSQAFQGLMPCQEVSPNYKSSDHILYNLDYDDIMQEYEGHFLKHLKQNTFHDPRKEALHFLGLQRWNSISPAEGRSLGGGYLLYRTDKEGLVNLGIAIDPGFDFVRNLFRCGFSLQDIDIILLSHSHLDHIRDFESIVTLLKEVNSRTGHFRRVQVILTLGVHHHLSHIFNNPELRSHVEPLVIDIEKDIDLNYFAKLRRPRSGVSFNFGLVQKSWRIILPNRLNKNNAKERVTIWPTRAYHQDYSEISDSFGFVINIPIENKYINFGYTGDTKWVKPDLYKIDDNKYRHLGIKNNLGIAEQYKDCDVLLIHLGSLIDHKKIDNENPQRFETDRKDKFRENCERLIREKNHPYFPGLIGFMNEICEQPGFGQKLVLIGEFGEELRKKIRIDLIDRLKRAYKIDCGKILPIDVGLDVIIGQVNQKEGVNDFKFWCCQCDRFHSTKNIEYEHFGHDEALFYLCQTCKKTSSIDILQDRLRHLYEVGRSLRTT